MNKERAINIENLRKAIVKVEVAQQHCPTIEDEMILNRIIFGFNTQAPGAVHGTAEVQTLDASYRLIVWVDKEHLEKFKKYIKKQTDGDITFC